MEDENKINNNDVSDLIDRAMSDDNSGATNIQSIENNDITIAIIPPNIVAKKSLVLNSISNNSLTNPHRTETFVPKIE